MGVLDVQGPFRITNLGMKLWRLIASNYLIRKMVKVDGVGARCRSKV